jgi:hypothetical protein
MNERDNKAGRGTNLPDHWIAQHLGGDDQALHHCDGTVIARCTCGVEVFRVSRAVPATWIVYATVPERTEP